MHETKIFNIPLQEVLNYTRERAGICNKQINKQPDNGGMYVWVCMCGREGEVMGWRANENAAPCKSKIMQKLKNCSGYHIKLQTSSKFYYWIMQLTRKSTRTLKY